jgi:hypothetical protein
LLKLPDFTPVIPPITKLAIIGGIPIADKAAPPIMGNRLDKKPASGKPV